MLWLNGDNFRVEARVVIWEEPQVLKVPVSALFRQNNNWAVYALRHGRAVLIPVQIGRSSVIETQVLTGLNADDEVILYPGDRITDNQRVHPVKI